jgi:transglutaminase-like putative cysteine protease
MLAAESLVELVAPPPLPDAIGADAWDALDAAAREGEFWDMLAPSPRAETTVLVQEFAQELDVQRHDDPLGMLRRINTQVFEALDYVPNSTDVDSPIDDVLKSRRGVCQDYAHVMIALVRGLAIPCRYVSGYLYYQKTDRSTPDASHAWVEAFLPTLGWIGFDPTNNLVAGERHVRVAVGRDYDDVPPTRGIFKGKAESELTVEVHVNPSEAPFAVETLLPISGWQPETDEHQSQQQ